MSGQPTGKPWVDRKFDLQIEDDPQPFDELKRLVRLQRAYLHMNAGDLAMDNFTAHKEYEKWCNSPRKS